MNDFVIIGLSPGNSYFKKEKIDELLRFCNNFFLETKVMIPDLPSEHTYKAIGYNPKEAQRKARLNGNTLQNHSKKSIAKIPGNNVQLLEWKDDIEKNKDYKKEYKRLMNLYKTNKKFRNEIRRSTKIVIEKKLKSTVEIESAIDKGIYYLLKELAFLSASPKMFGVKKVAYAYHDRWQIFEDFIKGKFDSQKRKDLGFEIIRTATNASFSC